jgi:uncharacterized membrane protein YbaN (DUF454 family)
MTIIIKNNLQINYGKFKKYMFLTSGTLALILGIIGAFLPILPTAPFLLVAAACYAKGSKRFHKKLVNSGFYRKYISKMVKQNGMTLKAKLIILIPVLCMLLVMFLVVTNIYLKVFAVILGTVKTIAFIRIRTIKEEN